jgi:hypothetical protein
MQLNFRPRLAMPHFLTAMRLDSSRIQDFVFKSTFSETVDGGLRNVVIGTAAMPLTIDTAQRNTGIINRPVTWTVTE